MNSAIIDQVREVGERSNNSDYEVVMNVEFNCIISAKDANEAKDKLITGLSAAIVDADAEGDFDIRYEHAFAI
jgi:hypothetical protein